MADNTVKILLLVVILVVLGYVYQQNKTPMFIGSSGEAVEKAAEKIVNRDCSGTEYIIQKPCSRDGIVLDGLTDEKSGAGFETHILDKNHEGFVRQLGDGVCPPKLVDCNVDPPKPCSGNTWLDALCVRLDVNGNELVLEDGNADACGDGLLKQTLDTNALDYAPATKGGLCTFERSGACQKTCPEPQPPVCNYTTVGWQNNDLGCVKSQDDMTPVGCGETGVIQQYKAATMNTEYCKDMTRWVSCSMEACPQDCEGSWSDWTPNPDACDVQPSESRIYSITKPSVGNTQFGYGRPCEEIHDKVETRSRQDPIDPCCTQSHNWTGPIGGVCSPRGTGKFIQSTEGQCAEDIKSQIKPCCYEAGDWEDIDSTCLPTGKKRQKQTTTPACRPGTEIREVDCCYTTEWENVGMCNSNGEQPQSRIMAGSCTAVPTEDDKELCDSELARLKTGSVFKDTPETSRSASLLYNNEPIGTGHSRGRLDSVQAWSAKHKTVGQWYQIDNGVVDTITGIAIKGRNDVDQWVKTFKVKVKGTSETWVDVDGGKIYTGNTDRNTQIDVIFDTPVEGRYVRIYPQTWNSYMSLRADIIVKGALPDTLAKLEGIMDVVPADLSTITDSQWRKIIPACAMTRTTDENFAHKTVPCHYVGDWQAWGSCNGQKMYRQRNVVNSHLINPTHGTNTSTQEEKNCKNCKGEWRQEYESKHGRGHRRNRHKRADWQRFYKTQNESGGGHCSGLPSHGSYRKTDNYAGCGHTHNEDPQCGFRYASWKWMEANYNNNAVIQTIYSSG